MYYLSHIARDSPFLYRVSSIMKLLCGLRIDACMQVCVRFLGVSYTGFRLEIYRGQSNYDN